LAEKAASSGSIPPIHRLTLTARDLLELTMLQDRAAVSIASLLDGLKGSLQRRTIPTETKKRSLTVTAFVVEQPADKRRSR
jgi:hypothetical protein